MAPTLLSESISTAVCLSWAVIETPVARARVDVQSSSRPNQLADGSVLTVIGQGVFKTASEFTRVVWCCIVS